MMPWGLWTPRIGVPLTWRRMPSGRKSELSARRWRQKGCCVSRVHSNCVACSCWSLNLSLTRVAFLFLRPLWLCSQGETRDAAQLKGPRLQGKQCASSFCFGFCSLWFGFLFVTLSWLCFVVVCVTCQVDLESRVGKTRIIDSQRSKKSGYYCDVCDCVLKDSVSFLDHINGKKRKAFSSTAPTMLLSLLPIQRRQRD